MFRDIEEYKAYIKPLSNEQLLDILANVDRVQYPERYDLVKDRLVEKQSVFKKYSDHKSVTSEEGSEELTRLADVLSSFPGRYLFAIVIAVVLLSFSSLTGVKGETILWGMNIFLVAMIFVIPLFMVGSVRGKEDLVDVRTIFLAGIALLAMGCILEAYYEGKQQVINALFLREPGRVIYLAYMFIVAAVYMLIDYSLNRFFWKEK